MKIRSMFITAALVLAWMGTAGAGTQYLTTTPLGITSVPGPRLVCTATNIGKKNASVTVSLCSADLTTTCNGISCNNLAPWGTCQTSVTGSVSRKWCRVEIDHGSKKRLRVALTVEDSSGNTLLSVEAR